jgi:hypothetical protein
MTAHHTTVTVCCSQPQNRTLTTALLATCTLICRNCSVPAIKDVSRCPTAENALLKLCTQTCRTGYSTVLLKDWRSFNSRQFSQASGSLSSKMFQKIKNRRLAILSQIHHLKLHDLCRSIRTEHGHTTQIHTLTAAGLVTSATLTDDGRKVKIFCWATDLDSKYTVILCPAVGLRGHDTSVLGKPRWANFLWRKQGYIQTEVYGHLKVHTFLDIC